MISSLNIAKALADWNRIRALCALEGGELCVCQLQDLLGLAPSTTSKHLSILAQAGLVRMRKEGRWAWYRLAAASDADEEGAAAREAIEWALRHATREKEVLEDRRRLARILSLSPEELCQLQAKGQRCCSSAPGTPAEARWPKAGRTPSGAA